MIPSTNKIYNLSGPTRNVATSATELLRRTTHGATGWTSPVEEKAHYQPQDQDSAASELTAEMGLKRRKMFAGEPEDAGLTGGTRSLMRRLLGLNLGKARTPRRVSPLAVVIPGKTPQVA